MFVHLTETMEYAKGGVKIKCLHYDFISKPN